MSKWEVHVIKEMIPYLVYPTDPTTLPHVHTQGVK